MPAAAVSVAGALRGSLRQAPRRVLGLDFDGTLAPFCSRRMEARPYPGIVPLLEQSLSQGDDVAFFTGRPVEELRQLLGPLGNRCPVFGCHGGEEGWPGERPFLLPLPSRARESLDGAESLLRKRWKEEGFVGACPLERKHGALAWHTRNFHLSARSFDPPFWASLAHATGLRLLPFDGGWELRHGGFHKGKALLEQPCFVAYLGDDLTDEDAFAVVAHRGLGVLVRPRWRPTQASAWCPSPEDVRQFLALWGSVGKGAA